MRRWTASLLLATALAFADCATGRVVEPINVSDPPAKLSRAAVERCVEADLQAGKRQLLGSAIELMFEDSLEIPGLNQAEVDRLQKEFGVEFVWYIHNGHEFIIGEERPTILDRKWAFAEQYNRFLYRKLTAAENNKRKVQPQLLP
jgi:hypothetical protein